MPIDNCIDKTIWKEAVIILWVCRTGKSAQFYEDFLKNCEIAIPWQGYNFDLSAIKEFADFRSVVEIEKNTKNQTSVSNWAAMLYAFCVEMQIGDYVLIPERSSKKFALGRVRGDYAYRDSNSELHHFRKIEICCQGIPKDIFSRSAQYSLGAFRTIFKPKPESEIIDAINRWRGC